MTAEPLHAKRVARSADHTIVANRLSQYSDPVLCGRLQSVRLLGSSFNTEAVHRLAGHTSSSDALADNAPTGGRGSMHADTVVAFADHACAGSKGARNIQQSGE